MSIFRNKEQFSFGHSGLKLRVENIVGSRVIKIKNKTKKQRQQTKQKQKKVMAHKQLEGRVAKLF